jgi:ribosomal protein S20
MPIIKSAIKRMRQTEKRRARNVTTKRNLRTALKTLTSKSTEDLRKAQSEIDTAVKKNLMSKNTAARKKSQLVKQAKEAGVKPTTAKVAAKKAPVAAAKPATAKKTATTVKKAPATKKAVAKKPAAKKAE